jgi:maleylacetate reductase
VMRWNKSFNGEKQAKVARAMGCEGEDAGDVLDRFIGGLGMPRTLSAAGVKPEHFDRISKQAMGTPWIPRNPRPIPTPAQVMEILQLAA